MSGEVVVEAGTRRLPGLLSAPTGSRSLVVFAHGSGSSRHSPRNRRVARTLNDHGHATLLFDLLTDAEAQDRGAVFDIGLLADRLVGATRWSEDREPIRGSLLGFFGASTGAAAALSAAARLEGDVSAVVSRGGRPDLAGPDLGRVTAPTLLIVGSLDTEVLRLNHVAAARLRCPHEVVEVPGATHLFDEPGTMDETARLAAEWFDRHLAAG